MRSKPPIYTRIVAFWSYLDHFQGLTPLLKVYWPNNVKCLQKPSKSFNPDHRNVGLQPDIEQLVTAR